jgi:nucleotide-binding universal stress UspA family protein
MRLLADDIEEVRLLRVMIVPFYRLREFDGSAASHLRQEGYAALSGLAKQLAAETGIARDRIERQVRVAVEWAGPVIVSASQQRAELICLEAPRTSLHRRFAYGDPLEKIMRDAPCDVAVFRGPLHGDH